VIALVGIPSLLILFSLLPILVPFLPILVAGAL